MFIHVWHFRKNIFSVINVLLVSVEVINIELCKCKFTSLMRKHSHCKLNCILSRNDKAIKVKSFRKVELKVLFC